MKKLCQCHKVFSKIHKACITVILILGFMSADQIEKRKLIVNLGHCMVGVATSETQKID